MKRLDFLKTLGLISVSGAVIASDTFKQVIEYPEGSIGYILKKGLKEDQFKCIEKNVKKSYLLYEPDLLYESEDVSDLYRKEKNKTLGALYFLAGFINWARTNNPEKKIRLAGFIWNLRNDLNTPVPEDLS